MEKFIQIYDNLIPFEISNSIENLLLYENKIPYKYLFNITDSGDFTNLNPGFNYTFLANDNKSNYEGEYYYFLTQVLFIFSKKLNISVDYIIRGRTFLHLPINNVGLLKNQVHVDTDEPHWVCLYYVNDSDGDTILFKDDKKTEIKRVTPKKGRIVFFNGLIPHCSSNPSKTHRSILNFDFIGKKL